MILVDHRHHQPQESDGGGSTASNEEISLSNNVASWQSPNNSNAIKIDDAAVIHRQPENQRQVAQVDDDDDDDEEDDSFTYSSSEDDEDENKRNCVAKRLPEIPQPNVNNQISNSNKVNISTTNKNVYEGKVVIHQTFYNNLPESIVNPDGINVAPIQKIINGKDPEATVEPKLLNVSSHPLYPFTQHKVTTWCTKRRLIAISGTALIGIALIILIVYLTAPDPTFEGVCIVSRVDWTAEPALEEKPLAVPLAKYVIIMQTQTVACFTQSQCAITVKNIQKDDIQKWNKTDIRYNYLVGGDGIVYTGRGWDLEGEHTKNYDNRSIAIGFIGIFENDSPSLAQIDKGEKLIKLGVDKKKIRSDYVLVGQKQCTPSTNNPGKILYDIIKMWDNWSPACF